MTRDAYNDLRDNLRDKFDLTKTNDYSIMGGVTYWIKQSGIRVQKGHINIVCTIHGSIPYPFQFKDRERVMGYLKTHRFGQFSREFLND